MSSWRTIRRRVAPSAPRIAISRCRAAPRASSRFATFAQAMSSTNATAPASTSSAGRTSPASSSRSESTRTVHPVSKSGNSAARPAAIVFICVCACAIVAPGFSRPTTEMLRPRGVRAEAGSGYGIQRSVGLPTSELDFISSRTSGGMMPTTVAGVPFNWIVRPMMPGSPPKRRSQNAWLRSVTLAAGSASSLSVNARPTYAGTPSRWNRSPITSCVVTSSGSPVPVSTERVSAKPTRSSKTVARSRQRR